MFAVLQTTWEKGNIHRQTSISNVTDSQEILLYEEAINNWRQENMTTRK